ncbi:cupin domain-containing protein [Sorangium sp. So ce1182]|uniref:cupin domain-containing protein n=1 Tax=Sorangium sp. So ce1182 TaxID=3133334 RepID=UPI003F635EA8
MARPYRLVTSATRIPVPGGKLIEELFGRVNTGTDGFSLAHMVAPSGWSEPAQTPSFGELTLMIRGRMRVEIAGEAVDLSAGQAIWTEPDQRVRYSNPFDEESEYFALCIPAFAPDLARRDGA